MERQNKQLTVLMIILLIMLVPVLIQKGGDKPETPADPDAPPTQELLTWKKEEITGLTLKKADGTLRFVKEGDAWKLVEPRELAVESRKVEEIIERFDTLKIGERALSGALADYALDEAKRAEVILSKADGTTFSVFVGRDAPVGYKTYVKVGDEASPVLSSTKVSELANRGLDDFRNREIWDISSYEVSRIRMERGGRFVALRKEGDTWWLGDNGPVADKEKVSSWLNNVTTLKADSFLDGEDPAELGLLNPTATITLEDGEGSHTLRFGTIDEVSAVLSTPDSLLVRVNATALELFNFEGWESARLFQATRFLIEGIEVQIGDLTRRYVRQEGAWADMNGKAAVVDPILEVLTGMEADRSQSPLPDLTENYGVIRLSIGQGRQETVRIGQQINDNRLCRAEAGGPPFLLAVSEIDGLVSAMK